MGYIAVCIAKYASSRRGAKLRRTIRGYRSCEREGGFSRIRSLRNTLVNSLFTDAIGQSNFFFGESAVDSEVVLRQFVLDRYGGGALNRSLYESLGALYPIIFTIPKKWRLQLASDGWKVKHFMSAFIWQLEVLARLYHGWLYSWQLFLYLWRAKAAAEVPRPHAVFEMLTSANLPASNTIDRHYDICSFYANWQGKLPGLMAICHDIKGISPRLAVDVPVVYRPPAYMLAVGRVNALRLAWWAFYASIFAALNIFFGRWGYALLLAEAVKMRSVRLCAGGEIASEYLFHASRSIYRPIWTYEVARHGAQVSLYFYATYVQPMLEAGYESQAYDFEPSTWPRFIVWDRYQEEMLRRDLKGNFETVQAGAIYFSDSEQAISVSPRYSIAVFDTQPHRQAAHFGISTLADLLATHPDYYDRFISDIAEALSDRGIHMMLKSKRDLGNRGNKRSQSILNNLIALDRVTVVPSDISAIRLIERCFAGVSVPFTSTAIYLRERGIPTAYYDPFGWMQIQDSGAHGIPLLQGRAQLEVWLNKVITASKKHESLPCQND